MNGALFLFSIVKILESSCAHLYIKLMVAACRGNPEYDVCFVVNDDANDGKMQFVIEATSPGMHDTDVIAFEPELRANDAVWRLPPPQHDVNLSLSLASLDYSKTPKLEPFCFFCTDLPYQLSFEWVGSSEPQLFFETVRPGNEKLHHVYRSEEINGHSSSRATTLGKLDATIEFKFYLVRFPGPERDFVLASEQYTLTFDYGSVISTVSPFFLSRIVEALDLKGGIPDKTSFECRKLKNIRLPYLRFIFPDGKIYKLTKDEYILRTKGPEVKCSMALKAWGNGGDEMYIIGASFSKRYATRIYSTETRSLAFEFETFHK
ncbi:hypothetical protein ABG067_004631 [Albugo candida]